MDDRETEFNTSSRIGYTDNFHKLPNGSQGPQGYADNTVWVGPVQPARATRAATGGITLTASGAQGVDSLFPLGTSVVGAQGFCNAGAKPRYEVIVKTPSSVANSIYYLGLVKTNTDVIATDTDKVFFRYESSLYNGYWYIVVSTNDSDTTYITNVPVAASTVYKLVIELDGDKAATCWINDRQVLLSPTKVLADADLYPVMGIKSKTAGDKTLNVKFSDVSRDI